MITQTGFEGVQPRIEVLNVVAKIAILKSDRMHRAFNFKSL